VTTRQDNAAKPKPNAAAKSAAPASAVNGAGAPAADLSGDRFFDYKFKQPDLLALALTHSSLAYERNPDRMPDPGSDNERLEFIGDAVLGLLVAEALYRRFPNLREGDLTRLRASLVSSRNLAQVAQRIELGPMLRMGRGEEHSGGQKKPALLANALEAVIAAMYLDGGLAPARDFVMRHIVEPARTELENALDASGPFSGAVGDYKSALQERLQAIGAGQPRYVLTDQSGPDHRKRFRIEVRIADGENWKTLAEAEGTTKKLAQQEGARLALAGLAAPSATKNAGKAAKQAVAGAPQ
jgi:ribonuclease III